MILFKPEHVSMILASEKTQTRRLGGKRWNVGAVHQCKTTLFGDPFARVRIVQVRHERLADIRRGDLVREGYGAGEDYKAVWERVYKIPWDDELLVWVVDFHLLKPCSNCTNGVVYGLLWEGVCPCCGGTAISDPEHPRLVFARDVDCAKVPHEQC